MEKTISKKVNVEIFGDTYPFRTDGDPQELKKLAAFVDKHMQRAAQRTRSLDTRKIAVLSALELADEYFRLKKDYDELVELLEDK